MGRYATNSAYTPLERLDGHFESMEGCWLDRTARQATPDLTFESAQERRVIGTDGAGLTFGIISLEDLKTLKRYANRSKDRLDLEILDKIGSWLNKP